MGPLTHSYITLLDFETSPISAGLQLHLMTFHMVTFSFYMIWQHLASF